MRAAVLILAVLTLAAVARADDAPQAEVSSNSHKKKYTTTKYPSNAYDHKSSYDHKPSYGKSYDGRSSYEKEPSYNTYDNQPYDNTYEQSYDYKQPKVIRLYATVVGTDVGPTTPLGATGVLVRSLSLTPGGPEVGKLWQSGILVDRTAYNGEGLFNYQGTIYLSETAEFPEGKLFFVGDGTGFGVAASTYLPKSIVGGTGPYVESRGTLVRIPPGGPNLPPVGPYYITLL